MATDKSGQVVDSLRINLKDHFRSSKFADFTILCEGQEFKVHKVVICSLSDFFSTLLENDWKESTEDKIELHEDGYWEVQVMIHFLYNFEYDNLVGSENRMLSHTKIYSVAEKYGIPTLKLLAAKHFARIFEDTDWSVQEIVSAVAEIYRSTPSSDRGLRDLVVQLVCKDPKALKGIQEFTKVFEDGSGFASDLICHMAHGGGKESKRTGKFECPSCNQQWYGRLIPGKVYHCPYCGSIKSDWFQADSEMVTYKCPNCSSIWEAFVLEHTWYRCIECGAAEINWNPYVVDKVADVL